MAAKIEYLTPAQQAKMPEYVEKWIKIGLNCDPCNFNEAKEHVLAAYKVANLAPPKHVILADSPWSAAVISAIFQNLSVQEIAHWCRDPHVAQNELFPTFCPDTLKYIKEDGTEVDACKKDELRTGVTSQVYGSHDAGWLSFYDFCAEELGLADVVQPLQPWIKLAKVCGWWAPYDEVCILQHRHVAVHLDDQRRLSNNKGLAVEYKDGFGVWSIDGMSVDEQIVMRPETQTLKQLEGETNADLKAIRISQFGWPRYIRESGATCIDAGTNDAEVTQEALFLLKDGSKKLVGSCKTGRVFAMGVHESCQTVVQARNWLSPVAGINIVGRT